MTGQDLVNLLETRKGCPYVFGAIAPKNDPNYKGAFDCAELPSWGIFQLISKLYGCENDASSHPEDADAGTPYWHNDLGALRVKPISLSQAGTTAGAILLRDGEPGIEGHIVTSTGKGNETIEAMGRKWGVTNGVITGRRWDHAFLIPELDYDMGKLVPITSPAVVRAGIYNNAGEVKAIQQALLTFGYHLTVDGLYGTNTAKAVVDFQDKHGLTPDGEVGPITAHDLGIS